MPKPYRPHVYKVIDSRVYNTGTAEHVCPIKMIGGDVYTDFEAENTHLYRLPEGRFFLAGEGGASSRWRRKQRNGHVAGSGIQLLTDDEARSLMESVDGPVEEYFEVEEG